MNTETEARTIEVRRVRRMMRQLFAFAEQSSLTGAFPNGAAEAAERYNSILAYLLARDAVDAMLFTPLTPINGEMTWDRVAVASKLLEGYLIEDPARDEGTNSAGKIIIQGLAGLDDLDKLKDLGRSIRENLPEFLRSKMGEAPTPPTPPTPPTSPVPPVSPAPPSHHPEESTV